MLNSNEDIFMGMKRFFLIVYLFALYVGEIKWYLISKHQKPRSLAKILSPFTQVVLSTVVTMTPSVTLCGKWCKISKKPSLFYLHKSKTISIIIKKTLVKGNNYTTLRDLSVHGSITKNVSYKLKLIFTISLLGVGDHNSSCSLQHLKNLSLCYIS